MWPCQRGTSRPTGFSFSLVNTMIQPPLPGAAVDDVVGATSSSGYDVQDIESEQYLQSLGYLRNAGSGDTCVRRCFNFGHNAETTWCRGTLLADSMMELPGAKPMLGRGFTPTGKCVRSTGSVGSSRFGVFSDAVHTHAWYSLRDPLRRGSEVQPAVWHRAVH